MTSCFRRRNADRFVDSYQDAIHIADSGEDFDNQRLLLYGYREVLNYSHETAIGMLQKNKEENKKFAKSWKKAEDFVKEKKEKGQLGHLPHDCQVAIHAYTRPGDYKSFNGKCRKMDTLPEWQTFPFQGMWLLLRQSILSSVGEVRGDFTLYRGLDKVVKVAKGAVIMFKQFVSTTRESFVAERFKKGKGTLFIINKAKHALGLKDLAWNPEEEEYLLTPTSSFEVTGVEKYESGQKIYLEYKGESDLL